MSWDWTLYTLASQEMEIFKRISQLQAEGEPIPDELQAEFDSLSWAFSDKMERCVHYYQTLEWRSEIADKEIKRLTKLKKSWDSQTKGFKGYIHKCMEQAGITKCETWTAKLLYRESKSLVVTDLSAIPDNYKTTEMVEKLDKKAITDAIKSGVTVPWAELKSTQNLQIK